ncbi:MAG: hypothetical protein ACOYJZ_04840 [Acutalibacter sp.]|jgi:fructan beta-fructosidase
MEKKTIKADKKYLLIPVADSKGWFLPVDEMQFLGVYRDGKLLEEHEVVLSREPRCWACLYLERYAGQELELRLEGGDESLLDLVETSDVLRDQETLYREPSRPLAHFTPMHGFMNDPNGLYYHGGKYHLFAQLNPYGFGVGNTHWLHAASEDLIHWEELPYALLPDESGRMYSGGGVVDTENTSGLGENGEPPVLLFYTAAGSKSRWSRGRYFETALAYSTDGGKTFQKYAGNPIVPHMAFMNRDPKVVWEPEGQNWVMFLFLDNCRYQLLYSKDLIHWEEGQVFALRTAAECPDLFCLPLDGDLNKMRWVLWGSTDTYLVGRFQGREFIPETEVIPGPTHQIYSAYSDWARSPGGYAAQTFTGLPEGRVVQLSWIRTRVGEGPFSSCMSVPNELKLVTTEQGPRLTVWPAKEVDLLREESFSFVDRGLEELERIPVQYQGEAMDMTFRFSVRPGKLLAMSVRGVLVVYDPESGRLLLPTGAYDIGPVGETLELRIITDRCSMEFYANGGLFHTSIATVLDPTKVQVTPVMVDPGTAVDLEIHKLKSMWE